MGNVDFRFFTSVFDVLKESRLNLRAWVIGCPQGMATVALAPLDLNVGDFTKLYRIIWCLFTADLGYYSWVLTSPLENPNNLLPPRTNF